MRGIGWSKSLLALGLCWGLASAQPVRAEGAEGGGKRVAVVNVSRVFNAYRKVKEIQEDIKKRFGEREKAMQQDFEALQRKAQLLENDGQDPRTNRTKLKAIHDLEMERFDLAKKRSDLDLEAEKENMEKMKQVLKEIRSTINEIGKKERVDMILRAPEFDAEGNPSSGAAEGGAEDQAPKTSVDLVKRFRENPVMYFSPDVDITQQVITKLNDEYKSAAGAVK